MESNEFQEQERSIAKQAGRAYLATIDRGRPKVPVVFPAFEGETIWIATKPGFAKTRQIAADPHVELFWETGAARPAAHLAVTRVAKPIDDPTEKERVWSLKLFGYDLRELWPSGPQSADFTLINPRANRARMATGNVAGQRPTVWRRD